MPTLPVEGLVLTLVLVLMAGSSSARPRRRFCERYPFAKRCMGIAAKRDVSETQDLNSAYERTRDLDAVEKLLLSSERAKDTMFDDFEEPKDENIEDEINFPSTLLRKIIKRHSTNTDIISQERFPSIWVEYDTGK